ncbi:MAG: CHAT domain-containing protein [Theionarchaea archaeon]|nr:CHAT domain-containing protein [Theionarchaea archaeon]
MMNQEEWEFTVIIIGAAVLATAIMVYDGFSLGKFWARKKRRENSPPPAVLAKAHTRHQRFYHQTGQRLISTTYVSFYLFILSVLGFLILNGVIIIQQIMGESEYNADELSLRLFFIMIFFLMSRWYYRQEHHHSTVQKFFAIILCVIMIDFVHLLTHKPYGEVMLFLLVVWIWTGGILQAILGYEVNYSRNIAYSLGLPCAAFSVLFFSTSSWLFIIFIPPLILAAGEWMKGTEFTFKTVKHFIPNSFPFLPHQSSTFMRDLSQVITIKETFRNVSPWEILYWALLTPVVLIPVTVYLQSREEKLIQYHDTILSWAQNEYLLNPETVADRMGLTLEDTYPYLNELVEDGKLQLYETPQGLCYGLLSSEEIDSFIDRFNLHKIDLAQKDRDFLDYLWEKQRKNPPKATLLSVLNRSRVIEISIESVGGSISSLKRVQTIPIEQVERAAHDLFRSMGEILGTLGYFRKFILSTDSYMEKITPLGRRLFDNLLPHDFPRELRSHHLIIETDMHHIPFELICSDTIFSLSYAMGRRLRVKAEDISVSPLQGQNVEKSRVLLIYDPESNLRTAVEECDYLHDELERLLEVCYLKGRMATRHAVLTHFQEGYSIIHYAGHVGTQGLQLADGGLNPSEISTHLNGQPLVFINGCNSVGSSAYTAEQFLRAGSIGYIGSIWEIHDISAARLAVDFYSYATGHTIGEALRLAKEKAFQENNIAWACFILFGDPTLSLI